MLEWLFHISGKCTAVECSSFQLGMVNIESKSFDRNKGDLSETAKRNHASVKWETVGKKKIKKKKTTEKNVMKLLNTAYGHFTWTDNLKPENLHLNYKNNIMERKNMNKVPWFKKQQLLSQIRSQVLQRATRQILPESEAWRMRLSSWL